MLIAGLQGRRDDRRRSQSPKVAMQSLQRLQRDHAPLVRVHLTCLGCLLLLAPTASAQSRGSNGPADPLHQLNSSVEALVRRVSASVVQVQVSRYAPRNEGGDGDTDLTLAKQRSVGSGVIIDPEGYIVTNAHVIADAQRVQVTLPSALAADASPVRSLAAAMGPTVDARIVGFATDIDVAILKVDASGLQALPLGNYDSLRQGELVFAFGSPVGLRNSVTMGVVSAVARQSDTDSPLLYIQTDAPINPGNSGGPLVNVDGELVGINTFLLTDSGGNQGLGFAIPSAVVGAAYPRIRKYGRLPRGEIGISVQTITAPLASGLGLRHESGVIVSDVQPGGPADLAGLRVQDIITSLDDKPTDSVPSFALQLDTRKDDQQVRLRVRRGSDELILDVPVIEIPHDLDRLRDLVSLDVKPIEKLGILAVEIDDSIASMLPAIRISSGLIVATRAAGWGGADVSLNPGDVIHAINGAPVVRLDDLVSGVGWSQAAQLRRTANRAGRETDVRRLPA
jgi:serine protease Do